MSEVQEETITEGSVRIPFKKEQNEAFYNPVQEFNRDLTIAFLNVFQKRFASELDSKRSPSTTEASTTSSNSTEAGGGNSFRGIKILEALSATGLRSLRYVKEIPGVSKVLANDIDENAVKQIRLNAKLNGISTDTPESILEISHGDANEVIYKHRAPSSERYNVIDLDPYGSPVDFLDGSVQAISEGGLLCVTFTDMAVLCGPHPDVCYSKYGGIPLKKPYCHEAALRIAINCIQSHANRYRRVVEPLLCISIDYYIRLFLRVFSSPSKANCIPESIGLIGQCVGCDNFVIQPLAREVGKHFNSARVILPTNCKQCNGQFMIGGPIWTSKMQEHQWITEVLQFVRTLPTGRFVNTRKRIDAILSTILEELNDIPLFYSFESLCHTLKISTPPRSLMESAFKNAGYRISYSHTDPQAIKTDAPEEFLWDFMRCLAKETKSGLPTDDDGSPRSRILMKQPQNIVDIQALISSNSSANDEKVNKGPRFLPNPRENWGPGTKAGKQKSSSEKVAKKAEKRAARKAFNREKHQKEQKRQHKEVEEEHKDESTTSTTSAPTPMEEVKEKETK